MIVKEMDLFKGLDFKVVKQIAAISDEEFHLKDKVLFKRHEKADRLYILKQGTVDLVIDDIPEGVYRISEPGEVIGWSSLVDSSKYTASAVCVSDVFVFMLEKEKINRIFNKHPDFGLAVLRRIGSVFSKRLEHAYHELAAAMQPMTEKP